jgi:deoxyadenosine/deoxycytidine kinase
MASPKVVVVDGLIAAGKSTLISNCLAPKLREKGFVVVEVLEPVELWKSSGLLQKFYDDPSRYGFQFQTFVFHTRVRACQNAVKEAKAQGITPDIYLLERSVFDDRMFMLMLLESGNIQQHEYDTYMDLWTMRRENMPFDIDLFIYLKPSVDETMKRLHVRNRSEESGVSREYQEGLQRKHDEFLNGLYISGLRNGIPDPTLEDIVGTPILHFNTNDNFIDDEGVKEELTMALIRELGKEECMSAPTNATSSTCVIE